MIVGSIGTLNSNKIINFTSKIPPNTEKCNHYATESMTTVQKQIKIMNPILLVVLLAAMVFTALSCSSPKQSVPAKATPTPTSGDVATPTPTSPVATPTPAVSPVQNGMINMLETLGILTKGSTVKSFNWTDYSDNTINALNLNKEESSNNQQIYYGTSVNMDFGTTKYIRCKITKPSDGVVIVQQYTTSDGNAPSSTNTWKPNLNVKYVEDSQTGYVKKYSLNPDGSINQLLATISPETENSLWVTTPNGDEYGIGDISVVAE